MPHGTLAPVELLLSGLPPDRFPDMIETDGAFYDTSSGRGMGGFGVWFAQSGHDIP